MNEKGNPEKGNPSGNQSWDDQSKRGNPSQEKGNNESGTRPWEKGLQNESRTADGKKVPVAPGNQNVEQFEEKEDKGNDEDSSEKNSGTR